MSEEQEVVPEPWEVVQTNNSEMITFIFTLLATILSAALLTTLVLVLYFKPATTTTTNAATNSAPTPTPPASGSFPSFGSWMAKIRATS